MASGYDSLFSGPTQSRMEDYLLSEVGRGYMNTYALSNALVALLPGLKNPEWSGKLHLQGAVNQVIEEVPAELEFVPTELKVEKSGLMPIYMGASQGYWDSEPTKTSELFDVQTQWLGGQELLNAGQPATLRATVTVKHMSEYVMVEIPVPASCSYVSKSQGGHEEVHREYFKEKVSVFCGKLKPGSYTFDVELLPRYQGTYHLNPAKAELMYYPIHYGHEGLKKVKVK